MESFKVFKAADDANITAALAAVRAVSVTLSSATVTSSTAKSPLESFLQLAVKDSLHTLEDPELKYAKLSGRMLVAAAAASGTCFRLDHMLEPSPAQSDVLV